MTTVPRFEQDNMKIHLMASMMRMLGFLLSFLIPMARASV